MTKFEVGRVLRVELPPDPPARIAASAQILAPKVAAFSVQGPGIPHGRSLLKLF